MRRWIATLALLFTASTANAHCPCHTRASHTPQLRGPNTHPVARPCKPETLRVAYAEPTPPPVVKSDCHTTPWLVAGFALVAGSVIYAANHKRSRTVYVQQPAPSPPNKKCP